jgi:hypothetical protein
LEWFDYPKDLKKSEYYFSIYHQTKRELNNLEKNSKKKYIITKPELINDKNYCENIYQNGGIITKKFEIGNIFVCSIEDANNKSLIF